LVVPLSFTPELSYLRAREFVELLKETLNMHGLVVGPEFAFGYQREGTAAVLTELGKELGFTVEVVEPVQFEGRIVSSTAIRACVQAGEMADAAWMLSRPFILTGFVVEGDHRGRQIVGAGGRKVETHIFDYDGDLYNAKIRVAFNRKLRGEIKFNGVDALVKQLHEDVAQARIALAEDADMLPPSW